MIGDQLYQSAALLPDFSVKIDGSDLFKEAVDDVLEIVVENSVHLPDACTIRLHDYQFRWVDDSRIKETKSVEVKLGFHANLEKVFEGEIVAIEMDAAAHMVPILTIRAL